ncbi:UbiA prenyltransferase family [Collybia nuda]|uniref:UbiA prenyltransferase family n=1 Tax=Collybia nuda TaxID=64659 RepID=A0A9P5YAI6_9AGAR|nr:UbiA prenyltransferase family [Collybia nuda]
MNILSRGPDALFHVTTLFLFCKSDVATTLVPVSVLAFAATPICSKEPISHGCQAVFWLFMHLLQFNLSNQLYSVAEDRENHPYRPLASGRISFKTTFVLRWASTVTCLVLSALYGRHLLVTSFMSGLFAFLYNETPLHKHWFFRASFNSVGYGAFKLGTMLISNCDRTNLDPIASTALLISMGIIWTTVYVQDFQDVEGDSLVKRATFPLVYPTFSRVALVPGLLGWSFLVSCVWDLGAVEDAMLAIFSIWVALRFYIHRGPDVDKVSYAWYNLWLGCCFLLPGYYRVRSANLSEWGVPNLDVCD